MKYVSKKTAHGPQLGAKIASPIIAQKTNTLQEYDEENKTILKDLEDEVKFIQRNITSLDGKGNH